MIESRASALAIALLALAVVAAPGLAGCAGSEAARRDDPLAELLSGPSEAGATPAAGLELPRLGGGTVSLTALRGRPVLVTLFTTWCLRCQAEAEQFNRLHEDLGKGGEGLAVVGIALDVGRARSIIETYVEVVGLRFPVALATPDDLDLVGALGQTPQVPRTVLLDRSGRIVLDQSGQTDFPALEERLRELLAPPPRPRASPP